MKKPIYLLFLFFLVGSSFTYRFNNGQTSALASVDESLKLGVKIEQPHSSISNDGIISLNVSGGTAPYTIQVISTFSPSQVYNKERITLKKLGVGNYTIMVQDAHKQVLQETIELTVQ
jgi:hypothetical protein